MGTSEDKWRDKIFYLIIDPPCPKCKFWDRPGHHCFLPSIKDMYKEKPKCKFVDQIFADFKEAGYAKLPVTDKTFTVDDALKIYDEEGLIGVVNAVKATMEAKDAWHWLGDGEDHLESLICPILIEADDLRELLANDKKAGMQEVVEFVSRVEKSEPSCMSWNFRQRWQAFLKSNGLEVKE